MKHRVLHKLRKQTTLNKTDVWIDRVGNHEIQFAGTQRMLRYAPSSPSLRQKPRRSYKRTAAEVATTCSSIGLPLATASVFRSSIRRVPIPALRYSVSSAM